MSSPASLASRYCGSALESWPETGAVPPSDYTRVPRQSYLPVHLLGLAPLLGCAGPVAGDVKLQDDSSCECLRTGRSRGHLPLAGAARRSEWPERSRCAVSGASCGPPI